MTASQPARLAATPVAGTAPPRQHLLMLHGIYGRGRNWQPIARRIVAERPDYTCWLVDLRHHGDAERPAEAGTLADMAADVRHWIAETGIAAQATLGHSYGGKVALALAAQRTDVPVQTWVIDSTPEVKTAGGSAWDMLSVVRALPDHFASRAEAVDGIVAGGFSTGVAQWMSTNLERREDGFRWGLDFTVMEALLRDFFAADLWPVLEQPAPGHDLHVLKAHDSNVISPAAVDRLRQLEGEGEGHVHLHELPGGHWIHAETPDAVADLLLRHLP